MYEYLIEYSSAKSFINNIESLGVDIANHIFEQFQKFNVSKKNDLHDYYKMIVLQALNDEMDTDSAYEHLLDKAVFMLKKEKSIDWYAVRCNLGRNDVFSIMDKFKDEMLDEDYWMLVGYCYTTSDFCYNDYETLKHYLNTDRPKREYLMNKDEREFYNNLPYSFTIYRGCSLEEIKSGNYRYSWTLNKEIAEFFAHEYKRNDNIKCDVIERTITKKDVLGYFNDREEEEILLIPQ